MNHHTTKASCGRSFLVLAGSLLTLVSACQQSKNLTPPQIWVEMASIYVGIRSTNADLEALHFDMQIGNHGEDTLIITSLFMIGSPAFKHGDQHCAFNFQGPDKSSLAQQESSFIRGWYKPTVTGDDLIAIEIDSNSATNPQLLIPVCGRGVPPGTTDDQTPPECVVPPSNQPGCAAEEGT